MEIPFSKLHGNGNDFIMIDEFRHTVIPDEMKAQFALLYCDRRFGIGADGVIYLLPSEKSSIRMRILQPDQSEAEMCGNGIRCLAKFAFDAGYVKESCTVETLAGELGVSMGYNEDGFTATIAMTTPQFDRKKIPAAGKGEYVETIEGYEVHAVNTGVPHAVIIVDAVDAVDIDAVAPKIRHHKTFLKGANVNFVEKTAKNRCRIRTFERGVEGETFSCATGATASAAVLHHLDLVGDVVNVETRGGPLVITLKDGKATMQGPATTVFSGVIPF